MGGDDISLPCVGQQLITFLKIYFEFAQLFFKINRLKDSKIFRLA